VFPLYRRRFRCLAIPPYYNLRFTKHAAFQQFSAPPFRGAPRRFEVVDMTAGPAAIVVAPQVGDVAPVLAALLAHRAWWSRLSVGSRDDPVQTVA
jgi:hypothetical protein